MGSDLPGKIVLQDRPEAIAIAEKDASSETFKMVHDFQTEQTVKGASPPDICSFARVTLNRCKSILLALHNSWRDR